MNRTYLLLALLLPAALPAQESDGSPRGSPEFRGFDFWIGNWIVRDTNGIVIGRNEISRIAGGCGMLEEWNSVDGGFGTSLNSYDTAAGEWRQNWVGSGGLLLHLRGGPANGSMVLASKRSTAADMLIDRISWTPKHDGSVRQVWEISRDRGDEWRTVFVGVDARE